MLDDVDYHLRREAQERALAATSIDPSARIIHVELADRHAEIARRARIATDQTHDQAADPTVTIPQRTDALLNIKVERSH